MMTAKRKPKKSLSNSYSVIAYNVVVQQLTEVRWHDEYPSCHLNLNLGTLVNENIQIDDTYSAIKIVNFEHQYEVSEEDLWICPRKALLHVDKSVWPILSAIPSPVERVFLLKEADLLKKLSEIDVGGLVTVLKEDGCEGECVLGVVKYKGPIAKKGPGIYFGVEVLDGVVEDGNDGTYGNQKLFSCPPGTGMFVSVEKLRPGHWGRDAVSYPHHSRSRSPEMNKPSYSYPDCNGSGNYCDCEKSCDTLCIGDRVVWISDDGHTPGTVKTIKCSENDQLYATVQFDKPVRTDFITGPQYRKTLDIPAIELVRESDFYGADDHNKLRNGDSNWKLSNIKETNNRLNQATQDFLTLNTPPNTIYEDGASSGSEGSGYYDTPESSSGGEGLTVGSLVEVPIEGEPAYGVIRWIGTAPGDRRHKRLAGIEMEEEHPSLGDGSFNGRRYFQCNPKRSLFISLNQCRHDSRFHDSPSEKPSRRSEDFGGVDSPIVPGFIPPMSKEGDISSICGKYRGIQGHHNSCYLDATLFSMFTFTSVFDSLLYRPATSTDIPHYNQVQKVLREEIVNPLRANLFVRADRVMKLRTLMERLSSVSGLTTEEKDPEEFLTSLIAQILKAEPFLKLSSGQEAYHYQLFVEKDEALTFPTVQQLFEQSFLASDLKLKEVPSCLIIQMPRFGKAYKMYPRILPSQLLDVTDIIEDSPRQCTVCGNLAEYECKQCFEQCDVGLQSISFCRGCLETAHSHERRKNHKWKQLTVPEEFTVIKDHCFIPRLYMQLFAVVCIETSHYVSFVKCGTGADAPWCFFDSMADRKGERNGYNIPEMVACPDLPFWLSEKGACALQQIKDERQLPEHAKRLLCDAYMCMYQSTEVMMYR